jgi:hypothetical protein
MRCGCGYEWKKTQTVSVDSSRCAWESNGQRCSNAGTLAEGTQGSDKWYCSGHYECSDGKLGQQILLESLRRNPHPDFSLEARKRASFEKAEREVPKSLRGGTVEEYREHVKVLFEQFGKKKPEGRYGWAEKIMKMVEDGENVPYLTRKIAQDRLAERMKSA